MRETYADRNVAAFKAWYLRGGLTVDEFEESVAEIVADPRMRQEIEEPRAPRPFPVVADPSPTDLTVGGALLGMFALFMIFVCVAVLFAGTFALLLGS